MNIENLRTEEHRIEVQRAVDFQRLLTSNLPLTLSEKGPRGQTYYHAGTRANGVKLLVCLSDRHGGFVAFLRIGGVATWGPSFKITEEELKTFIDWSDTYSIQATDLLPYFKSR